MAEGNWGLVGNNTPMFFIKDPIKFPDFVHTQKRCPRTNLQVATEQQLADWEARTGWNPFDLTKVWPHRDFPLHPAGVLELNRNPDNYHADVGQVAFSPANAVPGMGYSPDKMLQGRMFAYHDAQRYRVSQVGDEIVQRQLGHFDKADSAYGAG